MLFLGQKKVVRVRLIAMYLRFRLLPGICGFQPLGPKKMPDAASEEQSGPKSTG
jgi:hypothetical protein